VPSCIEPEKAARDHSSPLVRLELRRSGSCCGTEEREGGDANKWQEWREATMSFEGNVRVGQLRDTEEKTEGRGGRSGGGGGATMNLDLDRDVGETGSQSKGVLERRCLGGPGWGIGGGWVGDECWNRRNPSFVCRHTLFKLIGSTCQPS
jgi:hypothetical protein